MRNTKTFKVLSLLRELLNTGEVAVGEKLPAERVLALQFSCSRETVRRALLVLEKENEVWRHVGQGTFYGPRPGAIPLRKSLLVQVTSVEELVQARYLVEPAIAAEAARNATAPDIARLNECISVGRVGNDRFECQQADDIFHRTIAEVAKNRILYSILTFLSEARRRSTWQSQWDRTYRHIGINEFKGSHSDQHQRIVSAINDRDPKAAEVEMRAHLQTVIEALQLTPGSPQLSNFDKGQVL
ncbi:FadR/GntR family transcriptional regulator [Denitrobaculum tricleocarpae]|uniref:FadR family transcriptional regulator n=1 Tax=Denitrobaculum tricleocarpae TaxID=2591009 RepID=A0A545U1H3_9PROT|nr:FCD domain-containing protein [Denitrobaculum tricleocarpae]TQV83308.1 FadR family transcriptional regulator [Denitrobaculum tricleocarpae]